MDEVQSKFKLGSFTEFVFSLALNIFSDCIWYLIPSIYTLSIHLRLEINSFMLLALASCSSIPYAGRFWQMPLRFWQQSDTLVTLTK